MHYGGSTPKRSVAFSNHISVHRLDKGKLPRAEMVKKTTHKLAKHWVSSSGEHKWSGRQKELKDSQPAAQCIECVKIAYVLILLGLYELRGAILLVWVNKFGT